MFLKKSDFKNQNGRTMLEILAVIVIMAVLTVIGIVVYSQAVAKHSVNLIYEDVLMQGEQFRHRGSATGKSIFDSAIGNKTRSGFQMFSLKEGATFSIVVHDIPMDNCNGLKEKKWPTDQVARIRINDTEYAPDKIECNVSENFNLTVVFWSNMTSSGEGENPLPTLCSDGCLDCQICENNVCKDNCEEGNICTSTEDSPNGVCIVDLGGRQICELDEDLSSGCYCPEGRDISNDTCGDCLAIENYQPWTQPILTSNGSFGSSNFAVKASSEQDGTRQAWRAFDGSNQNEEVDCWHSNVNSYLPAWIAWYTSHPIKIKNITLTNRHVRAQYANTDGGTIKNFEVQYSDDNTEWQSVFSGQNPQGRFLATTYTISSPSAHRYWRIYVTSAYCPEFCALGELTINADELQTTERILDPDTLLCE